MNILYLNGQYLEKSAASISIMDRGFLYGDAIYEVVALYRDQPIRLAEHIERLNKSLEAIRISHALSTQECEVILDTLLEKNAPLPDNCGLYIQVSRGVQTVRTAGLPTDVKPTVLAFFTASVQPDKHALHQGFKAITLEDPRRRDGFIKMVGRLPALLAHQIALDHDALEAILIREGLVMEGTSSNVFVIKNDILYTPPLYPYILGGITRDLILDLARELDIPAEEKDITETELEQADHIWITSSTREIVPIVKLNDRTVGEGTIGELWSTMMDAYHNYKEQLVGVE